MINNNKKKITMNQLPKGARLQSDGSIVFPMKGGVPPDCNLDGFVQDPNDTHRWIQLYLPCKYRCQKGFTCPSGKVKMQDYCKLIELQVNIVYCNQVCQKREE